MRVQWTRLALLRADEAAGHIASDSPAAARRWLSGLRETVRRLEEFPESGRVVPDLAGESYRELLYGKYRIVYRIETYVVTILTVRHLRRDLDFGEIRGQ